ncbi:MAG: DUF2336 domain-containing protein [Alphaproteobacteria bacterium]|jgi:uncharacterized protein (DUF2336 family)|nr:DUF2336 domain-containing protein [Alphaproteobacteria bacterium]
MLKKLFGRHDGSAGTEVTYENQRQMIQAPNAEVRHGVASSPHARPEVLYYLVDDEAPEVRRAVAQNPATPMQAAVALSEDEDDLVRCELARKIGRLIPDLPEDERDRTRDVALQVLETLARDQLARVRQILSETIRSSDQVPRRVVRRLAQDVEAIVAAPVLEYSPLLDDADLREIIAAGSASEALQAIARRANLSEAVTDDVVATFDAAAVATLLANESAQIREETLDTIIDSAAEMEAWHEPLVMRPELSIRAMRRISGFVASALIEILATYHDIDDGFRRELRDKVQHRLDGDDGEADGTIAQTVEELNAQNALDDDALQSAIENGQRDFAVQALSLKSGLAPPTVDRILATKDGKTITSLAWKAGLSMRTAMMVQTGIARVPPPKMLHARNGTDYPLSPSDMEWQIEAMS